MAVALWAGALTAQGQTSSEPTVTTQLWGNVILNFPKGKKWFFDVDFEPKTLLSGGEKWWSMDITPTVEYYPASWIDLVGETDVGYTRQSDEVNTTQLTPRVGFRLNILNDLREHSHWDFQPLGRVRVGTLVRVGYRTTWYSNGASPQHEWRLRMRLESKAGINHADMGLDCTLYGLADYEYFVTLDGATDERFVSQARARAGLGFRFSYRARAEILYIREWTRKEPGGAEEPNANILDLRLKLFF